MLAVDMDRECCVRSLNPPGRLGLLKTKSILTERHFEVHPTTTRPKMMVTVDGAGVVSRAGRGSADLVDAHNVDRRGEPGAGRGARRTPGHDPGRVLVDLAIAIADGAETISDIAVLADQPALFGPVASDSTCWRLLDVLATVGSAPWRVRPIWRAGPRGPRVWFGPRSASAVPSRLQRRPSPRPSRPRWAGPHRRRSPPSRRPGAHRSDDPTALCGPG